MEKPWVLFFVGQSFIPESQLHIADAFVVCYNKVHSPVERKMPVIAVIDYGAGNIQSVVKALRFIGCEPVLTGDPAVLARADAAVLPGVGSFGDAMEQLHARGLAQPIRQFAASGRPFLGICLGLQLLFESSEESPGVEGLGILKGKVVRFPDGLGLKIPHIGWNSLSVRDHAGLLSRVGETPSVDFVHSVPVPFCSFGTFSAGSVLSLLVIWAISPAFSF